MPRMLPFNSSSCSSDEKLANWATNSSFATGSSGFWFWSWVTKSSKKAPRSKSWVGKPEVLPKAGS